MTPSSTFYDRARDAGLSGGVGCPVDTVEPVESSSLEGTAGSKHAIPCRTSGKNSSRLQVPLSAESDTVEDLPTSLRADDGSALSWKDAADVIEGEYVGEWANHAYASTKEGRARRWYGRLLDTDRRLRREFDNPHIVFVSLRGSPCDELGRWFPPLDFLAKLNESTKAVGERLRYALREFESEWCAVLAGSEDNAVPHWHYLAWVDGSVSPGDFAPLLDAHESMSPVAGEHDVREKIRVTRVDGKEVEPVGCTKLPDGARELKPIGKADRERGLVSPVARYVGHQIPHINGASGRPFEIQHGATCWAYTGDVLRSSRGFGGYHGGDV